MIAEEWLAKNDYTLLIGVPFVARFNGHIYQEESDRVMTELLVEKDPIFLQKLYCVSQINLNSCSALLEQTGRHISVWSGFWTNDKMTRATVFVETLTGLSNKDLGIEFLFRILDIELCQLHPNSYILKHFAVIMTK